MSGITRGTLIGKLSRAAKRLFGFEEQREQSKRLLSVREMPTPQLGVILGRRRPVRKPGKPGDKLRRMAFEHRASGGKP